MAVASRSFSRAIGANDRIRLGLIGCGGRGNYLLAELLSLSGEQNLEVSVLCDVWKLNLETTAESLKESTGMSPRVTSRYQDVVDSDDVDAVVIATPDFAHTPILIDAMEAGKDAYVEKPMATRMGHARKALEVSKQRDVIVQVGTQRRSDPRYQKGAKLVQSGLLGKITQIQAGWHDCRPRWARKYDNVREADVDWDQFQMFLKKRPFSAERFRRWHLFKDYTVGTPGLLGSHLIDVATWFMDSGLPRSAVSHGGIYIWKDGREHADTLDCVIEYPEGFIINYSTRLGNRYPVHDRDSPIPTTFCGIKGTFDTSSWTARPIGGGENAISEEVHIEDDGSPGSHVLNWVECLRTRRMTNAPIEVGFAHSVASMMCFLAWESGRRQSYDDSQQRIFPA
jgi:predicted dehydrogenase